MRVFWEQTGILLPLYRLIGTGLTDRDIAARLRITEAKVNGCETWLLRFLKLPNRQQLVHYASSAAPRLSL